MTPIGQRSCKLTRGKVMDESIENNSGVERLCLTVPEAAGMLGISRNFAYELVKRQELPVIKFGKRILIPRAALAKMLEKVGA